MPFHSSLENLSREQHEKREQCQDPHMERPWSTFQSTIQLPPIARGNTLFPAAAGHFPLIEEGTAKTLPPRKRISQDGAVSVTKKARQMDQPAMSSQEERSQLPALFRNDASAMTMVDPYKKPPPPPPPQHWIPMDNPHMVSVPRPPPPPSNGPAGTFGVLKEDGQMRSNGQISTLFIEEKPPFTSVTHRASWMQEEMQPVKRNKRGRPPSSAKQDASLRKSDIPMPRPILNSPPAMPSVPSSLSANVSESTPPKKASTDSASSRQSTPTKQKKRRTAFKKEPKEQLYCICRQPYDRSKFMIACDRCDQWFHGDCVGISDKEGEFIDYYYCPDCAKVEFKSKAWKPPCANPNCQKPARISHHGYESRYCSNECGMQVARARVQLAEIKRREAKPDSESYTDVINMQRAKRNRSRSLSDKDDMAELEKVRNCKARTKAQVAMVEKKLEFLGYLLYQLDERRAAPESNLCGFDSRLAWDDYTWEKVERIVESDDGSGLEVIFVDGHNLTDEERNFNVCSEARKKCHKHADWERIKLAEIEHDRAFLFGTLERLQEERNQIKARFKRRREENDKLDWLANATTSTS